ncbi:MAG: response regulator [Eubacteriales bacterium]|nr:response regulator [Eubacteriales bacterium]
MKLLFIDDEPIIVKGLVHLMDYGALGYQTVLEAVSAKQAISVIEKERPDVIVSDVVMPEMTGLELLRRLRDNGLDAKVIFLSGYPDFAFAQEAIALGASDYLLKPVDKEKLAARLRESCDALAAEREMETLHSQLQRITEGSEAEPTHWQSDASACCLILMRLADTAGRTTLENNLLRFSAFSKAESCAEAAAATAFVKGDHLVVVVSGKDDSEASTRTDALLTEINRRIEAEMSLTPDFERSTPLRSTQEIPEEHQRLLSLLETRSVSVPKEENAIDRVKTYILAHFADNLSLEVMASVACMNASYFSSYFRKQTGMGFKDYLTRVRLEAAQRLLRQSDLRIYEIAERVGFSDPKYFSETFRRFFGLTPQAYRDQG